MVVNLVVLTVFVVPVWPVMFVKPLCMIDEPNVPGVLVVAFLQTVIEVNVVLVVRCV